MVLCGKALQTGLRRNATASVRRGDIVLTTVFRMNEMYDDP
jgi:hypothetical protein